MVRKYRFDPFKDEISTSRSAGVEIADVDDDTEQASLDSWERATVRTTGLPALKLKRRFVVSAALFSFLRR